MDQYREDGFQYLYIASQNNSGSPPSQSDLQWWANRYTMTDVAVLGLAASDQDSWDDIAYVYEADLYIPTIYHLDGAMQVLSADAMVDDPGRWLR